MADGIGIGRFQCEELYVATTSFFVTWTNCFDKFCLGNSATPETRDTTIIVGNVGQKVEGDGDYCTIHQSQRHYPRPSQASTNRPLSQGVILCPHVAWTPLVVVVSSRLRLFVSSSPFGIHPYPWPVHPHQNHNRRFD